MIAFDLLSEVERSKKGTVKAIGSFTYMDLEMLNAQLKVTQTNLHLSQQAADLKTFDDKTTTYPSFAHAEYQMSESYSTTLARDDHYFISFDQYLEQFQPDACLLQAEGYFECWKALQKYPQCKTFLYVQNGYELQRFQNQSIQLPHLLSNSQFIQTKVKLENKLDSHLLYPAIDARRYLRDKPADKNKELFTVLFVNPVPVKGLEVFLRIAEELKEVHFLTLEGWSPISQTLFDKFQSMGNVSYLPKTWNMKHIYEKVDLLIAPSQWEEAFGRVIVEAHASGVPTLASDIGGLPEASGEAGFITYDFRNPKAWVEEIKKIKNNPDLVEERRLLFKQNVERFTPANAAQRFLEIIETV